jgi:transcriptional regulator with XRE-family HTH domain
MQKTGKQRIIVTIRRIRTSRQSKDYSQDYLAAKLGISQNAYSKIELGYSSLSLERLFNIAEILEVDVNELINGSGPGLYEQVYSTVAESLHDIA